LKPDEPLPIDAPGCRALRDSNEAQIKEGMEVLSKALELRHDYDDAMAHMNLLYRERAEIQCMIGPVASRISGLLITGWTLL